MEGQGRITDQRIGDVLPACEFGLLGPALGTETDDTEASLLEVLERVTKGS